MRPFGSIIFLRKTRLRLCDIPRILRSTPGTRGDGSVRQIHETPRREGEGVQAVPGVCLQGERQGVQGGVGRMAGARRQPRKGIHHQVAPPAQRGQIRTTGTRQGVTRAAQRSAEEGRPLPTTPKRVRLFKKVRRRRHPHSVGRDWIRGVEAAPGEVDA